MIYCLSDLTMSARTVVLAIVVVPCVDAIQEFKIDKAIGGDKE